MHNSQGQIHLPHPDGSYRFLENPLISQDQEDKAVRGDTDTGKALGDPWRLLALQTLPAPVTTISVRQAQEGIESSKVTMFYSR